MDRELMKGSIDILLLSEIITQDKYGFEIMESLKKKSADTYYMSEETLYTALKRIELKGLVVSYWTKVKGSGRRKYYHITDAGCTQLIKQLAEWQKLNSIIRRCSALNEKSSC
jgi:PadR family transcriptional regulator, regulatory protein PadR